MHYYKATTNPQLNTHVKAVHEGKKPHECDICGKKWARKWNLEKHVATVHKNQNVLAKI